MIKRFQDESTNDQLIQQKSIDQDGFSIAQPKDCELKLASFV
jgi:hypothetical protein